MVPDDDVPEVDVGDDLFYTCIDTIFTIQSIIENAGSAFSPLTK